MRKTTKSADKKDYWDKIADDVSSGYGAEEVEEVTRVEESLNEDQEPGDEERGDS
jgi:hypothetical protein